MHSPEAVKLTLCATVTPMVNRLYFSLWVENVCFSNNKRNTELIFSSLGALNLTIAWFPLQSQTTLVRALNAARLMHLFYVNMLWIRIGPRNLLLMLCKNGWSYSSASPFLTESPTGPGAMAPSHPFGDVENELPTAWLRSRRWQRLEGTEYVSLV